MCFRQSRILLHIRRAGSFSAQQRPTACAETSSPRNLCAPQPQGPLGAAAATGVHLPSNYMIWVYLFHVWLVSYIYFYFIFGLSALSLHSGVRLRWNFEAAQQPYAIHKVSATCCSRGAPAPEAVGTRLLSIYIGQAHRNFGKLATQNYSFEVAKHKSRTAWLCPGICACSLGVPFILIKSHGVVFCVACALGCCALAADCLLYLCRQMARHSCLIIKAKPAL